MEGTGIKREADRIIQEREARGESFRVYVVDGTDVNAEALRNRLTDGITETNYEGWKQKVQHSEGISARDRLVRNSVTGGEVRPRRHTDGGIGTGRSGSIDHL